MDDAEARRDVWGGSGGGCLGVGRRPERVSQRRTVRSQEAVAMRPPPGENATPYTRSVWPPPEGGAATSRERQRDKVTAYSGKDQCGVAKQFVAAMVTHTLLSMPQYPPLPGSEGVDGVAGGDVPDASGGVPPAGDAEGAHRGARHTVHPPAGPREASETGVGFGVTLMEKLFHYYGRS